MGRRDSLDMHLDDEGEISPERMLVHAGIIEALLNGRSRHQRAAIVFVAGGPASGKSTLAEWLAMPADAVIIDVDLIRAQLPEYAGWQRDLPEHAAQLTHREASDIASRTLAAAIHRGHNIILRVCYATVSVDEAQAREAARFATTRRRVPADVLATKHGEVSRGLSNVAQLAVDRIEIYDMSGPSPRLLATGPGGRGLQALEVVDPEGYAAFLEKGRA